MYFPGKVRRTAVVSRGGKKLRPRTCGVPARPERGSFDSELVLVFQKKLVDSAAPDKSSPRNPEEAFLTKHG